MICIGTKRGVNYGLVYRDGEVVGRVARHSRVAAGTGGHRRTFWTAYAILDGVGAPASLGTRHTSRRAALRAIRMFWQEHPIESMRRAADAHGTFTPAARWNDNTRTVRAVLGRAVNTFKRERWDVCGIAAPRYAPAAR